MNFIKKNIVIKKRRAVSQAIGALFALAIVAVFGSVLVIQGVQGVQNFTSFLNIFEETEAKSAQEVFIVEHVRFNPNGEDIEIWLRNTGKIDIIIDRISIVKINSQELVASTEGIGRNLFQQNYTRVQFTSSNNTFLPSTSCTTPDTCSDWQDVYDDEGSTEYRITVTTTHDKSVESVAGLFNS